MIEIKNILKSEISSIFFDLVIETVKKEKNIYQKDIAERIGISPSELSFLKYYGFDNTAKHEVVLNMIIEVYQVEYTKLVEQAENIYFAILKREEKVRKESEFNITGIAFLIEKGELIKLNLCFQFYTGMVLLNIDDSIRYDGEFWDDNKALRSFQLMSDNGETIQLYLNEQITKKTFEGKRIITGTISFVEDEQLIYSQLILINSGLIKEFSSFKKIFTSYFIVKEIQYTFKNEKNKTLDKIVEIIESYKNYNRNIFIKLPHELTTSYKQFLDFFADYVRIAKGVEIQFDTIKRLDTLEIHVNTNKNITVDKVGEYLDQYLGFAKQNIEKLKISIDTDLSKNEFNLLVLDIKHQVTSLRHSLEIANLKNGMLSDQVDYLKELTTSFAKKENVIHTQIIQGGEQQFADKIENK